MKVHNSTLALLAGLALALSPFFTGSVSAVSADKAPPAPEFTHGSPDEWINSPPLKIADLRGSVVLIDFWTFDCWNCYRSIPWLHSVEKRYGPKGLKIIGVHSPEFEKEKVRANVVAKVKEFVLQHPVMLDNDFSYWKALHNRYWPAFYLIDKQGRVRAIHTGETHEGNSEAAEIERTIATLLEEPA